MNRPRPVPLRPDFAATRRDAGASIVRAVLAEAKAELVRHGGGKAPSAEKLARELWPSDAVTPLLLQRDEFYNLMPVTRAVTAAADTTTAGWASDIATIGLTDFLLNMGPASAASQLLARALVLNFDQYQTLGIPSMLPAASNVSFVAHGAAVPVRQLTTAMIGIQLKKLPVILAFTREMLTSSLAEATCRQIMVESIGLALDSAMLDATAGTDVRPAGLCAINALTPATPTSAGTDAMMTDLGQLAGAVAGVGGLNIAFVADPASAVKMQFNVGAQFTFPIFASKSLAAKTVICIAIPALCGVINPTPQIRTSSQATVHMDTSATAIATGGTLASGGEVRSLWQTDTIGIRFIADVAWCLRADNSVAYLTGVNW
jgi:hypothetical protein